MVRLESFSFICLASRPKGSGLDDVSSKWKILLRASLAAISSAISVLSPGAGKTYYILEIKMTIKRAQRGGLYSAVQNVFNIISEVLHK